jgi:hypothetical protein
MIEDEVLVGDYQFQDSAGAVGFGYQIEPLETPESQIESHISGNKFVISITPPEDGEISINDFILASRIDYIYEKFKDDYENIDWLDNDLPKEDWLDE